MLAGILPGADRGAALAAPLFIVRMGGSIFFERVVTLWRGNTVCLENQPSLQRGGRGGRELNSPWEAGKWDREKGKRSKKDATGWGIMTKRHLIDYMCVNVCMDRRGLNEAREKMKKHLEKN